MKHSRDGVLEQNLADGSAKKVGNKAEEAVLKAEGVADERFDKLKAAGLVVEDVKKPDHRKLQFGRNNPDIININYIIVGDNYKIIYPTFVP